MVRTNLVVFDLDGVLVDTKLIHFEALNFALVKVGREFKISIEEHLAKFDGLDTMSKLAVLEAERDLPRKSFQKIWAEKQKKTREMMKRQSTQPAIAEALKALHAAGFVIGIASNSIRSTVDIAVERLQIGALLNFVLSNEDVKNPKPHPEIYWRAMMLGGSHPNTTWVVEDSSVGRASAYASGAHVVPVTSSSQVTAEFVSEQIITKDQKVQKAPWHPPNINVLIPMAGAGSRFVEAGYTFPKPLIEVNGRSMIELVVKNLNIEGRFIFIVQREHNVKYNLTSYLNLLKPNSEIVVVDGVTDGAARTALVASDLIDSENPLLIANSDQFVDWDSNDSLYQLSAPGCDGGVITFTSTHPKWSFAAVDSSGWVQEVAEKKPISDVATTGIYYWARGSDFVKYAEQMIAKNIRTNGEFYICPVFNEAIADGKKIRSRPVNRMWGLGTPEDLRTFLGDPEANRLTKAV